MATKVTRVMAQKVADRLVRQWGVPVQYGGMIQVVSDWDGHDFVIIWEGGPFDWTILASGGGRDEFGNEYPPIQMPKGVWCEPVNGCVLGLYRQ